MNGTYSNPMSCVYNFPSFDFGAAAGVTTHAIAPPAGKQGKLVGISVNATEAFLCDATNAMVKVGTTADIDAYGLLTIPDGAAVNTIVNVSDDSDVFCSE